MADNTPAGSLPTELISEKTFYTLGGASAAVLLTCWAINYVAVDVSWLTYKSYRLIGIILSEVAAFIIMFKTSKKESMKWLFAFLNGLLIFVNASGLNIMTSSYIFNPAENSNKQDSSASNQFRKEIPLQAGIFSLPRMISWWPDEKLVKKYEETRQENNKLASDNNELRTILSGESDGGKILLAKNDSLQLVLNSMQTMIDDKQKQIDQLGQVIKSGNDELSGKLAECVASRDKKNDDLLACQLSGKQMNATINDLKNTNNKLRQELKNCGSKEATLTSLLQQVCNRISQPQTIDRRLMQQDFYRRMDWRRFCESFNVWNNPVE